MANIVKPEIIKNNEFMSKKWDEITKGRKFTKSDIPTLKILCQWHAVAEQCMNDLVNEDGELEVSFINQYGDEKAKPQISTLKSASAEIRLINTQLGIKDDASEKVANVEAFKALRGRANGSKPKAKVSAS